MKKWILFTLLLNGIISGIFAQDQIKYEYCQANVSTGIFNSIIQLDSEGRIPFKLSRQKYILDENGQYLRLPSAAQLINFMSEYGWEFDQFFPSDENNSNINILFKRPLKTGAQDLNPSIHSGKN